jgi:TRAP-type C4-dicarboxylate transport system permease small subunit
MYYVAGTAIVIMMLMTTTDVVLRYLGCPVPGTYELVSFLASIAVSFAIAHTFVTKGHVAVNLLVRLLPSRVQALIDAFTNTLSLFLFACVSWRCWLYASELKNTGEVSLTLELPFYPFVYGIAIASGIAALVILVELLEKIKEVGWK